jgi:hypothetical protein
LVAGRLSAVQRFDDPQRICERLRVESSIAAHEY